MVSEPSSTNMEATSVQKRRKSTIKACLRCHRRKQRCVGFPACTNCQAAGIACSRDSTPLMRRLAGLSKEELLNKIEALEEQLSTPERNDGSASGSPSNFAIGRRPSTESAFSGLSDRQTGGNYHDEEEELVASSEALQYPELTPMSARPISTSDPVTTEVEAHSAAETAEMRSNDMHQNHNIDADTGNQLLTIYLESLHRRVPFCDYIELLYTLNAARDVAPMAVFRLYMACAIGSAITQLTGTSPALHPEKYFAKASKIRGSIKSKSIVEETEALLWTVLYRLRSSFCSEVWYTIGLAMRTAIEAGLHQEHTYSTLDPIEADMRRRLFWAIYVIERNICWGLKRPFSLADHDIDVSLPSPAIHPTCLEESEYRGDTDTGPSRLLDLNVFITTIQLSRLNSQAYSHIYRVDQPGSAKEQIPALLDKVQQFEASLPRCSAPDYDFLLLHVKNSTRVHIEPFLHTLQPSDPLFKTCLDACGSVCQLFKRLRLNRSLGYSFTMVNSVFIAGITICYIIFKDPALWTPTRANQLRACSSTLFAAAERNNAVRKYCDVLETIIESVTDHVEQVSNPVDTLMGGESPAISLGEGHSPQDVFDKLSRTFEESNFEFPPHSYPPYRIKLDQTSEGSARSKPNSGIEISQFSERDFSTFSIWDFIGTFDEGNVMTADHLFSGDQLR